MKYLLALLLATVCRMVFCQEKTPLIVNEPFPYSGSFVLKGQQEPFQITSLKGENIILDLFSSTCAVCFGMLPKVKKYQETFAGKLRFLLIGYEDGKVAGIYKKFDDKLKLNLDVTFDSNFFKQIKIDVVPTYVWINKEGKVVAVTDPADLTQENLAVFASGGKLNVRGIVEPAPYKSTTAYLLNGNGGADSNYLYRSLLGKWSPELSFSLPSELKYNQDGKNFNAIGAREERLYEYAYWGKSNWNYGDSLYGKVWPRPLVVNEKGESMPGDENHYCYSSAYRGSRRPDLSQVLRNDLKNYFGYEVKIVKQPMPYWRVSLVKPISDGLRSSCKEEYRKKSYAGFEYRCIDFSIIMKMLSHYARDRSPFVDETGIDYPIDIKIDALLTEQDDFFSALQKIGILIEKSHREMDVMIIKKKDVAVK